MSLIPRDSLYRNLFDEFMTSFPQQDNTEASLFSPSVDVEETKDSYLVSAELPGVEKKDVKVSLEDGVLTIRAETRSEEKHEEGKMLRQERRYGSYMRSFNVGSHIKESDIDASFKDGILTLTAPKTLVEAPAAKNIEVH